VPPLGVRGQCAWSSVRPGLRLMGRHVKSFLLKKIKKLLSLSPAKTYNNQKVKILDLSNKILLNNSIILDKV